MKQLTLSFNATINKSVEVTDEFYNEFIDYLDSDTGACFAENAEKWVKMLEQMEAKANQEGSMWVDVGSVCSVEDDETGEIIVEF